MVNSKWSSPENEALFREAVSQSLSLMGVCRYLGLAPKGGNIRTVKIHIDRLMLDISHHTGQGWRRGQYNSIEGLKAPSAIRRFLLKERGHKCEKCDLSEWMGEPIPIEMDHINGNNADHRKENLRLLCANCHSLTPTFRNKKRKGSENESVVVHEGSCLKAQKKTKLDEASVVKKSKIKRKPKIESVCECGKVIQARSKNCLSCANSKINWPPVEELVRQVRSTNYLQASKNLGVSDNAIRKYFIRNGIDPKSLNQGGYNE